MLIKDAVQDQPYISVPKTSEFQSGPRVVKMVLTRAVESESREVGKSLKIG